MPAPAADQDHTAGPALPVAPRTMVMGILNVTPDSFSDGGLYATTDAAIARGLALAADGADIVDVGGESTRPGARRVDPAEELARVIPVIEALAAAGVPVSVDTMRAATARAAVAAGACLINDVSGGLADPDMVATVASLDVDYVAMHWRAHSTDMDRRDHYADVVAEVRSELAARVAALVAAGVDERRIILDPGLGFSKVADSNWPLLARMADWSGGARVLVGASRKRFLGAVIDRAAIDRAAIDRAAIDRAVIADRSPSAAGPAAAGPEGRAARPSAREHATTAVTTLAAEAGAWAVRVHDVSAACDAIAVVSAWQEATKATR
ncbi:dihydropteroate synthase [Demequina lutea]|uniref:Dihydropteroate synthase n=1 Tax=Demequina lutea TaxID=431489 RepID=A0A7Z0CH51_9MICO|nr:dihydropteroate synthase [Demequina lutea]NYI40469.1 dihydropteroate synthase [Demequina lutea]